jgi:hypothetical protein
MPGPRQSIVSGNQGGLLVSVAPEWSADATGCCAVLHNRERRDRFV